MIRSQPKVKNILITGASSGIGAALAEVYSGPGIVLVITGRNQSRLENVAEICRNKGATVISKCAEVQDRDAMSSWIEQIDSDTPLDLVIANAGISGGTGGLSGESIDQARDIFAVNLAGVLNTIDPVIPRMKDRHKGQIAIMSSLAAFRGIPSAPAYSASKAAVKSYGEALRGELSDSGIQVSVICPGFIKSRITDANTFSMPMIMEAEKAARIMKRRLEKNRALIAFPWPMYFMAWLMGVLPVSWTDPIFRRMPKKS